MQELRTMKLNSSGDSGFLSSGDSSVNGDTFSGKFSNFSNLNLNTNTCTTTCTGANSTNIASSIGWGDKSIWGAPMSPVNSSNNTNSNLSNNASCKDIWSIDQSSCPTMSASNSLWETASVSNSKPDSNGSQEWLGSIWMIPQTPQSSNKANQVWDAPNNYQTFKNDINTETDSFQLLRPHDLGNNMWNSSPAAAAMSGHKFGNLPKESVNSLWAAPTPTGYNNYKVNSNPSVLPPTTGGGLKGARNNTNNPNLFGQNNTAVLNAAGPSFAAPQLMPITQQQQPHLQPQQPTQLPMRPLIGAFSNNNNKLNSNNHDTNGINNHHHSQLQAQNNACLQLFSDDFLNYFNNMIN